MVIDDDEVELELTVVVLVDVSVTVEGSSVVVSCWIGVVVGVVTVVAKLLMLTALAHSEPAAPCDSKPPEGGLTVCRQRQVELRQAVELRLLTSDSSG